MTRLRWRSRLVLAAVVLVSLCSRALYAGEVSIVVDWVLPDQPAGVAGAPVTFGVPFPRGALLPADAGTVRVVDDQGQVVPHQQLVTATWDKEGKAGVRWLLVDLQVQPERSYKLQFGADAAAGGQEAKLSDVAVPKDDTIHFDAGPLKGAMPTRGFDPWTTLECFGLPIAQSGEDVGPESFSAFYVEHETKGVFRSDLDKEATVVLEEAGPLRATLKADGWYTNEAGAKFCRYSVRLHFFRDRPDVKIEHTFIYTGLSKEDKIRAVGLKLVRAKPGQAASARVYVGNDDLLRGRNVADGTGGIHVIQDASERGRFDFYSRSTEGKIVKWGERGGGNLQMIGAYGLSLAIRDAWQQYPWALQVRDGLVDVQLWPRDVRLLDTTWDGYFAELTDRQKRYLAGDMERKEQDLDQWMQRLRNTTNATGAAKTHELWLSFYGPQGVGKYAGLGGRATLAREVAYPVLAFADPAWTCATEALDWQPHAARDPEKFRDEETFLEQMLTMVQDATAANNWYGWWDWGAYHQHLSIGPRLPRFSLWADDAGMERWHRARPKSHYHWGRYPWVQYMRTGDRNWLRYAQTYTLYSADRAHAHHSGNGRANGAEYHYDNSVVPWIGQYRFSPGGDQLASNLQAKDDYVYMYWLTGARRALDVLQANGELLIDNDVKTGSWTKYKPGFSVGNEIRNAGMQLERVMMLYQATWDERYLTIAKKLAAAFTPLDTVEKARDAELAGPGGGYFHQAATWAYQGMWFYDRVTNDPAFHKALLAFIERARDYHPGYPGVGNVRAFTYGYLLTKDPLYLDLGRASWDELVSRGVTLWQFLPGFKQELSPMPGFLGLMAAAPESWRKANLPTHARGGTLTWRYFTWNNNPHMVGTRAFLRDETDQSFSFVLACNNGGVFGLYDPQGKLVMTKALDEKTLKWARFEVPPDGQRGDYTLMCVEPSETVRNNKNPEYQPHARVLGSTLPVVVQAQGPSQDTPVTGRALYFAVPPDAAGVPGGPGASVTVGPLDARRSARLFDPASAWAVSTDKLVPRFGGHFRLAIPESMRGKVLGLEFPLEPDEYYEAGVSRPRYVRLEGVPAFVAGSPENVFVPRVPENYQAYQP